MAIDEDDLMRRTCLALNKHYAPEPRRQRKPSLVSVAKQAAKAGLEVARYVVDADGKISVVTGKPEVASSDTANEWDTVQ